MTLGLDPTQYQFDTYADEWNASVSATLLLGGMKTPVTMSVSFGAEGVVTYANGYLARPIQGDQYDLVGVTKAIARLNDQQQNWIGFGGGVMTKSGVATAGVSVGSGTAGSSGTAATTAAESGPAPTSTGGGSAPAEPVTTVPGPDTPPPVLVDPKPMPCGLLTDTPLTTTDGPVATAPIAIDCPPVNIEPLTVTLTGVRDDLTMVWDADGTVWLLPAYAFTDDQGGTYSVIGIDDAFIVLPTPEPVPMPEPMPVETAVAPAPDATTTPVSVDQASADKLVGLSEDAAIEQAKLNNWTPRVVARDGESDGACLLFGGCFEESFEERRCSGHDGDSPLTHVVGALYGVRRIG